MKEGQKMRNFKKRIGSRLVAAMLLCAAPCTAVCPTVQVYAYEQKEGVVTTDGVNVREDAGTEYTSVTKLAKGDKVTVLDEKAASNGLIWYKITFTKDGTQQSGYMHSAYVTLSDVKETTEYSEPKAGYVTADKVNVRDGAGTIYTSLVKLDTGTEVKILGEAVLTTGTVWYHISYTKDGTAGEGYMHSDYVRTVLQPSENVSDEDYEKYLEQQGFPESYRRYLRTLHEKNPLWIFVALPTGIEWENAVAAESKTGVNLVPSGSITSYKSLKDGAIDWTSGTWTGYDTDSWVAASESVIRYYMDPRSFLNAGSSMLQFESLKYESTQTQQGVANILKGTHMDSQEFYDIFMKAGQDYNISPYHLAARAKQETGVNGSNSTKAVKDAAYAEFNNYYNFFNIGAAPSAEHDAMYNGLARAKAEGWDTPEKSIRGGAEILAQKYIARGQNTLYLQKFDVVDGGDGYYAHQYMTNLLAAESEAKTMQKTYGNLEEAAVTYIVPVYLNMPDTPAACPTDNGSPYSVLSELGISGLNFDKRFDEYTFEYSVPGETQSQYIEITASAYAPGAVIEGTGIKELQSGENKYNITCTGTDGSVRTYTITVVRQAEQVPRMVGDANGDGAVDAMDALYILRASASLETLTQEALEYADVNHDGQADAEDAWMVLQYITGVVDSL